MSKVHTVHIAALRTREVLPNIVLSKSDTDRLIYQMPFQSCNKLRLPQCQARCYNAFHGRL